MSSVVIAGNTSGTITLDAPDVAGSTTLNFQTTSGSLMVNGPAFSAVSSAAQSIAQNTTTKLQVDTIGFDTASCFNTTNFTFTPNVAGYYQVNASVNYTGGVAYTSNYINFRLYKNGIQIRASVSTISQFATPCMSFLVEMNGSTDYLELYVSHTAAATLNFQARDFSAALVRSA